MNAVQVQTHVEAPVSEVFAAAADFERAPEVISGITKVEMLTDGPVGVGTRFRETRVMFGREATEEMAVVEFEPDRRYVLGAESHGARYRSELRFEPSGGGTDVVMTFEAQPVTFVAKLMSVLTKPMMKKMAQHCQRDLDELKQAVEQAP